MNVGREVEGPRRYFLLHAASGNSHHAHFLSLVPELLASATADQFFDSQPGLKSEIFSPGWKSCAADCPLNFASLRFNSSMSCFDQPTLENSTSPSGETINTEGTLVSP